MQNELPEDTSTHDGRAQWELGKGFQPLQRSGANGTFSPDFRARCVEKLENLGDTAMDAKNYDEAIKLYSDTLTLDPTNQHDILLKRSKVRVVTGSWEQALVDADKVWIAFHVTSDGPQ